MEAVALAARLNEVVVIFISIVLQSLPFVLVGVFASAVVQQYLTGRLVARWMPRRPLPAVLLGSLCGLVVPVCDCGAIPLARRLTAKGVPVYAALGLLLAAPVVNPIVIAATALAFQGNVAVVGLRVAMTLSGGDHGRSAGQRALADARLRLGAAEPSCDSRQGRGRPRRGSAGGHHPTPALSFSTSSSSSSWARCSPRQCRRSSRGLTWPPLAPTRLPRCWH